MTIETVGSACVGCSACAASCPTEAIEWKLDRNGFYAPFIKKDLCTDCGACTRVCPALQEPTKQIGKECFYGWHNDPEISMKSSSGGAFTALAQETLKKDGVVFGSVYAQDGKSVIAGDTRSHSLEQLRRSKYVVSDPGNSFVEVKRLLKQGVPVLYVGTPCHIAGLNQYLKGNTEGLLTCDFICGGIPSQECFRQHMEHLEKSYGAPVKSVNFRPKTKGWQRQRLLVEFQNGKRYHKNAFYDTFYACFMMKHLSSKDICDQCPYHEAHCSDLTIADFWGYPAAGVPYRKEGISLLVANTEKGKSAVASLKESMHLVPLEEKYVGYAYQKREQTEEQKRRKAQFFDQVRREGFEATAARYASTNWFKHNLSALKSRILKR